MFNTSTEAIETFLHIGMEKEYTTSQIKNFAANGYQVLKQEKA